MPPLLDQILAATRATLPPLRARRALLERQAADDPGALARSFGTVPRHAR